MRTLRAQLPAEHGGGQVYVDELGVVTAEATVTAPSGETLTVAIEVHRPEIKTPATEGPFARMEAIERAREKGYGRTPLVGAPWEREKPRSAKVSSAELEERARVEAFNAGPQIVEEAPSAAVGTLADPATVDFLRKQATEAAAKVGEAYLSGYDRIAP